MTTSLIATFVVIGLFGFGFYYILTSEKKRREKKRLLLQSLGFHAVVHPDPELVEQLQSLYKKRPHQKKRIDNMHFRKEGAGEIFIYEVWDETGKDNDLDEAYGMAVCSPYLDLPRFTLFPKADIPGKMAALANRMLERLVPQDQHIIKFEKHDSFTKRYLLLGNEEERIRHLFSENIITHLSTTGMWHVEGSGKLFTFSKFHFQGNTKSSKSADINLKLQEIRTLYKWFAEESRVRAPQIT